MPLKTEGVLLLPSDAYTRIANVDAGQLGSIPIYGHGDGMLDPGIRDAIEDTDHSGKWYPNSPRTELLVTCLAACEDVANVGAGLDQHQPWKSRRKVALLATPLVSLCDAARKLYGELGQETDARSTWPIADQKLYVDVGRRLKKHCQGPIRHLRNKYVAHVEEETLKPAAQSAPASAVVILPPLADSLAFILLASNYQRVFTWVRQPKGCPADEVEIMTEYPLALRVRLGADRTIEAVMGSSTLAVDPREHAREIVLRCVGLHNRLASEAVPPQPRIHLQEYDADHEP